MAQHWTAKDIPPLEGKVALVTGANSGLGYYTALELARKGACVIMACRSPERARLALERIQGEVRGAQAEVLALDLASLASIQACAESVESKFGRLDILVNNAGVMAIPRRVTVDGFEMQFGANHLGHFALTGRLLAAVEAAPAGRVVTVSSLMHQYGKMDFGDLMGEKEYDPWRAYSQSKLANLLFAYELQRRLAAHHSAARSLAAHPGYAATNLQYVSAEMKGSRLERWGNWLANTLFAQPAARGALPQLYAATAPEAEGGAFTGPDGWGGARGYPKVVRSSARSYDTEAARRLWQISETLTGMAFEDPTKENTIS